jgi:hypothetical protein
MSASDLQPLEVLWLFHGTAKGEVKNRMMVCVSPEDGFFLPINTTDRHRPCFALSMRPDHLWLDHDSHVECDILIFDEYLIDESMRRHGVVGYLSFHHVDDIIDGLGRSVVVSELDRRRISSVLTSYRDSI